MHPKYPKLKLKHNSSSWKKSSMNQPNLNQIKTTPSLSDVENDEQRISSSLKMKKFTGGYHNAICHITSFLPGDEPTKLVQKFNSDQGNSKTIDFTGVVRDISKSSENENDNKMKSGKNNNESTVLSIFQPIYHITGSNQTCMVSDSTHEDLNICFGNDDCCITENEINIDQADWYNTVDVNTIEMVGYYEPLSCNDEVYNEVEVYDIPNNATIQHNNLEPLFKLEDPYKYKMYDLPWSQMDGGSKCTITNNINLLKNVRWYNQWF